MNKVLVISAHYDDAVLSAGQFLAGRPGCNVATVFSGLPRGAKSFVTDYDKACGFSSSRDAMCARVDEDKRALSILGAYPMPLGYLDRQYNHEEFSYTADELAQDLSHEYRSDDYDFMLAPLGIEHPDHILAADAAIIAAGTLGCPLYMYEDLPHRVLWPEKVNKRLDDLKTAGALISLTFIGDGDKARKAQALMMYASQINRGDLDPYYLFVPERFHKVSWEQN